MSGGIGAVGRRLVTGFSPRRIIMAGALAVSWCIWWGAFSAANILAGVLCGLVVTAPGLGRALTGGVRLVPLLRLLWLIMIDLAKSTVRVSHEVLTPGNHTSESIVAVTVPLAARRHMLLYTAAITLTPGTVVVDTDMEAGTLYVHILHDDDAPANDAHVQAMADLAVAAFPVRGRVERAGSDGRP